MIGIVFEGCACRAAFHAGVAEALVAAGVPIGITAGASSGSIIAAAMAAGHGAGMADLWERTSGRSIVSWRRALHNRSPFDMSTIVRDALRESLGDGDLRAAPLEALCTVTRRHDLRSLVRSSRDEADFVTAVLGSCFFPVLYGRSVRLDGAIVIDGGVTDNLPVEALASRGAKDILAVTVRPDGMAFKSPRRTRWKPRCDGARVHVIHPREELPLKSWDFDPDRLERALEEGYARGREFTGT